MLFIDEWVIMPDHLHGILFIINTPSQKKCLVETHCNASLQGNINTEQDKIIDTKKIYQNFFGPQSHNLSAIIRGFKGATTKKIHLVGFKNFSWQKNYYDHFIRTEKELDRIREYIYYNPVNWKIDQNNENKILNIQLPD